MSLHPFTDSTLACAEQRVNELIGYLRFVLERDEWNGPLMREALRRAELVAVQLGDVRKLENT